MACLYRAEKPKAEVFTICQLEFGSQRSGIEGRAIGVDSGSILKIGAPGAGVGRLVSSSRMGASSFSCGRLVDRALMSPARSIRGLSLKIKRRVLNFQ